LYITFVTIIKIVIARDKINAAKIVIEVLQRPKAIVESNDIDTGTIVMPVAQEHGCFATLLPGLGSKPFDKV
jgi:hypothetical protein